MSVDFGFYPLRVDTHCDNFQIKTRDDFESNVTAVNSDSRIERDWIYPGPKELYIFGTGTTRLLPYPSRIFGLPKTHILTHKTDDPVRCRFLIWCFGFFVGMRMSDQQAGFLDATPIKPGVSNDIVWIGDSLMIALGIADEFFASHAGVSKVELTIRAAMHSYLTSDVPTLLDYEKFVHLYTAIDACYAAHRLITGETKNAPSHKGRIAYLCEKLGLSMPWWADGNNPLVTKQRNETLHEALFFGEPWGFSIWGGNYQSDPEQQSILLQIQKLTCRILIALLGIEDREYLASSVSDRQRYGVRLK